MYKYKFTYSLFVEYLQAIAPIKDEKKINIILEGEEPVIPEPEDDDLNEHKRPANNSQA
ncbi:hypothetical protein [Clostridium sp.]|uniref:hypothetical protein n=1 Tax=Clostridium sp. TaxID=1506 RepID=UPI0032177389